jgi:hypothetical protein
MADQGTAAASGAETGAAAGSVAGPYGALIGAAGGALAGIINAQKENPKLDVAPLLLAINSSGDAQKSLIANLPDELKPLYAQYQAAMGQAGTTLQGTTNQIGQNLLSQTKANYDPNSAAVQATLAALKQNDYSTLPGTVNNLKSQLAATGGLQRGGAARAITQAVMNPAAQFSQQAGNVQAQSLQQGQSNVQSAINKIAALDDSTAQQLFGMTTQQATNILTSGRQDLQNQLAQLINQSNTQTNQTLGVLGLSANNGYQNAVAENASQAGIVNGLINTGVNGYNALNSGNTSAPTPQGFDPNTMSTPNYANENPTLYGITQ